VNRPMLTREQYDRIRAALDARARQLIVDAGAEDRCSRCGGEYENVTAGCDTCTDRAQRRRRRQDPVKHAHDLRVWRETRRRRIARKRAAA
jgi:hypothetical protein